MQISNSGSAFLPELWPVQWSHSGYNGSLAKCDLFVLDLVWNLELQQLEVHQVNDGFIGNYIGKYLRMLYLINDKAYRAVELGCSSPGKSLHKDLNHEESDFIEIGLELGSANDAFLCTLGKQHIFWSKLCLNKFGKISLANSYNF